MIITREQLARYRQRLKEAEEKAGRAGNAEPIDFRPVCDAAEAFLELVPLIDELFQLDNFFEDVPPRQRIVFGKLKNVLHKHVTCNSRHYPANEPDGGVDCDQPRYHTGLHSGVRDRHRYHWEHKYQP